MHHYVALIHKDVESDYGVSFPDLSGCVTGGVTMDEARTFAVEALGLHLAGLSEDGETAPPPSSIARIMANVDNRKAVAVIRVDASERA